MRPPSIALNKAFLTFFIKKSNEKKSALRQSVKRALDKPLAVTYPTSLSINTVFENINEREVSTKSF